MNTFFPVSKSTLSAKALAEVFLPGYDIGELSGCRLYSPGINDTYQVKTKAGETFFCCGYGIRAYDLAVFRWCSRLSNMEDTWWEPYLRGYQEERCLSEVDVQAIPLFVGARYIWHMGLHAANAEDWGYGWLDDRYFDKAIKNLRAVEADYL